jgi:hypothetical protein
MACVELPKIPEIPSIQLLGGAELKGFLDFSLGPPNDCRITFNLLLQLAPLLASMTCLFKILNVIMKLEEFVTAAKPPFTKLPDTIPGVLGAIADLNGCIPPLQIPQLVIMIKGILQLVINFLSCFLGQLEGLIEFQARIDLKAAEGNPVLLDELICAQRNAKNSMDNLMLSLQPLDPIFKTVTMVGGIAGITLELPDMSSFSTGKDQLQVIADLKRAVDDLKKVINNLPS